MAKRNIPATEPQAEPESGDLSFEEATAELSRIVSRLESGKESLEQSLAAFERGMSLLRTCHRKLEAAARRIEIVTRQAADGTIETEPFSVEATHPSPSTGPSRGRRPDARTETRPESDDDDSRGLF